MVRWLVIGFALSLTACGPATWPTLAVQEPARPHDWWIKPEEANSPPPKPEPPAEPTHEMRVDKAVAGMTITATPAGAWQVWNIEATNDTGDLVSIDWDRSSFVGNDGDSLGRLIRGETRKIDSAKAQVKLTLAPSAKAKQLVIPEAFVEFVGALRGARLEPTPPKGLIGAKLVLAIEQGSATSMWVGIIAPKAGE